MILPGTQLGVVLATWFFVKRPKIKKYLLTTFISMFIFYTSPLTSWVGLKIWEVPPKPYSEVDNYDVGIVLLGVMNMTIWPEDQMHLNENFDRITGAMELYHLGKIDKILLSGGSGMLGHPNRKEIVLIHKFLLQSGIPADDLLFEDQSNNTFQNAKFSMELINENFSEDASILVISSGTHLRRAKGCFNKMGLNADYFSADNRMQPFDYSIGLFVPSAKSMRDWDQLMWEWVGYLAYWVVGYL
ncbi:MAG: YdcF family protein [Cyclobacteriaceae bacterium]